MGYDTLDIAHVKVTEMHYLHVQAFCHATLKGPNGLVRDGRGVLEQLVIGAHQPSGFTGHADMAK